MIRVNLLPHRTEFRQQQILEHVIVFVAVVLVALALVIAVNVLYTQTFDTLQADVRVLKAENRALSQRIGELKNLDSLRQDVEGKLAIVDELQAGRFRSLNTLHMIAEMMPENIWLENIVDKGGALSLTGMGESSKAVANFMRALPESKLFDDVLLLVDQAATQDGMQIRKFGLTLRRLTLAEQAARKAKAELDAKAEQEAKDEALP